ncbi:MAG: hypothetical protein D6732_21430, partial [Methanobacteriota archaeon]
GKKVKNSIQLNEGVFNYLNSNRVFYWFANNGLSANDPSSGGNGLYWSDDGSIGKGTIFADGLVWGGIVNGLVSCGGSTYRTGMIPGPYPKENEFIDRTSSKYRIYKIRKDLNNVPQNLVWQYKKDYDEWPVELGAPWIDVNGDGVFTKGVDEPEILGDETAWFVMNDSDTTQSMFIYGAPPMGLEVQVTLWSFDHFNFLGDAVFRKYKIINKGNSEIKDMYVGIWSDPDLGGATDDFVGCDTSLSLGYSYNGLDVDEVYGIPPAAGYVLLETPTVDSRNDSALINGNWKKGYKNLPLTGFSFYIGGSAIYMDPSMGVIRGSHELYNQMQGKIWDGSPYIDPTTGDTTNFC